MAAQEIKQEIGSQSAQQKKSWEEVQVQGLSAWMNHELSRAQFDKIGDLRTEFRDGVHLVQLAEALGNKQLKYYAKPQNIHERLANLNTGLRAVTTDLKVPLVNIGAEDLEEGSLKLTLGLLWSMFRFVDLSHLQIYNKGGKQLSEADALLAWANEMLQPYGMHADSLDKGFMDARKLAAILNSLDPSFIDLKTLTGDNEADLRRIFQIAEQKLGIPQLLDAKEVAHGLVDPRAMALYLALLYHHFLRKGEYQNLELARKAAADQEAEARRQKEAAARAREQLQENYRQAKERLAELEAKLREGLHASQEELDAQRKATEAAEQRAKNLAEERARLQEEIGDSMEALSDLQKEEAALKARMAELAGQRDASDVAKHALQDEAAELARQVDDAQHAIHRLQKAMDDQKRGMEDQAAQLRREKDRLEQMLRLSEQKAQAAGEQRDVLKSSLADEESRRVQLEQAKIDLAKQSAALQRSLDEEHAAKVKLEAAKDRMEQLDRDRRNKLIKNHRRWLVCVDESELSQLAMDWIVDQTVKAGGYDELLLLHVVKSKKEKENRDGRVVLNRMLREVEGKGIKVVCVMAHVPPHSNVQRTISRVAEENQVDGVILGSHGKKGLQRAFFGSVADSVARHAPCPVTIVRDVEAGVGAFRRDRQNRHGHVHIKDEGTHRAYTVKDAKGNHQHD